MPKRLTVQDKILIHLSGYARYAEEFECPEDISQSGIAEAIGKTRAHTTLELKRLKEGEHITERLSYVKGAKVKKKVYQLSPSGQSLAMGLKRAVGEADVDLQKDGKIEHMNGDLAVDALKMGGMKEVAAYELVVGSEGVIKVPEMGVLADGDATDTANAFGRSVPAKPFFGRVKEMADIEKLLAERSAVAVIGMPGIGKTAFARKLAEHFGGRYTTAYVKLYDFDSPASLARSLASTLKNVGGERMARYVDSDAGPDVREILWHLREIAEKRDLLMILDDYDSAGKEIDGFAGAILDMLTGGGSRLVTFSENRPSFYSRKHLDVDGTVAEYELGGLDDSSSGELLAALGNVPEDVRGKLARAVGGNPLALEMAVPGTLEGGRTNAVFEDFFSQMASSIEFLALASVLRGGFDPVTMGIFGFAEAPELARSAAFKDLGCGKMALQKPVKMALTDKLGGAGLKKAHAVAADFCIETGQEPVEALYHLVSAEMHGRAADFALSSDEYFLSNQSMPETFRIMESIDSHEPSFLDLKAGVANVLGRWDEVAAISEELAGLEAPAEVRFNSGLRMAKIAAKKGRSEEALAMLRKIDTEVLDKLDHENKTQFPGGRKNEMLANFNLQRGVVHRNLGNYDDAAAAFTKAAEHAAGHSLLSMHCMMEKGSLAIVTGDHESARRSLQSAADLARELGSAVDLFSIRLNLGMLASRSGDVGEAEKLYSEVAKRAGEMGLPRLLGYALVGRAEALNMLDRADESVEISREAVNIFEELDVKNMAAAAYSNIGTSHAKLGDGQSAGLNFKMALNICAEADFPNTLAQIYYEYGVACKTLGDGEMAAEMLGKARSIFDDIGSSVDIKKIDMVLSNL